MTIHTYGFCLLIIGLFCALGCGNSGDYLPHHPDMFREMTDTLIGETKDSPDAQTSFDAQASFEQNLLPILTARCALAGCHVADGPYGLDFRTYQSFIAGGDHVFSPGNAQSSDIIEEIVSGRMPPGGPRLSDAQIQLFINWINQQAPATSNQRHDDDDDYPDGYRDDDDYPDGYRDDDDDYPDGYRDDDDDYEDDDDDDDEDDEDDDDDEDDEDDDDD